MLKQVWDHPHKMPYQGYNNSMSLSYILNACSLLKNDANKNQSVLSNVQSLLHTNLKKESGASFASETRRSNKGRENQTFFNWSELGEKTTSQSNHNFTTAFQISTGKKTQIIPRRSKLDLDHCELDFDHCGE